MTTYQAILVTGLWLSGLTMLVMYFAAASKARMYRRKWREMTSRLLTEIVMRREAEASRDHWQDQCRTARELTRHAQIKASRLEKSNESAHDQEAVS